MKFFNKIGQFTPHRNGALLVILGLLIIETVIFVTTIIAELSVFNFSNFYGNTSIVFHLRLMVALLVIAIVIPSRIKKTLTGFIVRILRPNHDILERVTAALDWLSGAWRVHILLLPLVIFNVVGLILLMEQSPWITPDSVDFLSFAPWRTAAYPLFFRSIGIWLSDPRWIVIFQFLATLVAIIIFAESVSRLFINPMIGFLTGFALMTSWPFFYNSFALLADQVFFICLTAHLASIIFAAKSASRRSFLCAGIFGGLAIALKPAGIFLVFAVPLLLVIFRDRLKFVVTQTIAPFLIILAGSVCLNYWLFSSFSLSNIGGATTSMNTFLLLKKDTSARPQKLAQSIAESGEIHQLAMEKLQSAKDRSNYFRNHATGLNTKAVDLAASYLEEQNNKMRPHKTKAEYVSEFFGKNSSLNEQYNKFASSEFIDVPWYNGVDRWQEINGNLTEIAVHAILENKIAWLNLTLSKLYAGWAEVIPFFSMKRNLGPNSYLKNSNSNELVRGQQTDAWWTNGFTGYWVNFFDLIAALTFAVSILFPLPILILGMSMFVLAKFVKAVFYFQYIDPVIAALGYSAICLLLYHLEMSVVQIHFPRLLTAGMPPAVLLAISVLGLRRLIKNSPSAGSKAK